MRLNDRRLHIEGWTNGTSIRWLVVAVLSGTLSAGCSAGESKSPVAPNAYPQLVLDADVLWALGSAVNDIYNQNLAGRPSGTKNVPNASCPMGGTVDITGAVGSATNGITTLNLSYKMTACRYSGTGSAVGSAVALELTGTLAETGSFNAADNFKSINLQSTALRIVGVATRSAFADGTVSQTCTVSAANTGSGYHGSLCGR